METSWHYYSGKVGRGGSIGLDRFSEFSGIYVEFNQPSFFIVVELQAEWSSEYRFYLQACWRDAEEPTEIFLFLAWQSS